MKLNTEQFLKQLPTKSLQTCYWFMGDEPLRLQECRQALLQYASKFNFFDRQRFDFNEIDPKLLLTELYSNSLFSEKRIIEIFYSSTKIIPAFSELILQFCAKPNPKVILIIHTKKLESSSLQTNAYKKFESIGMVIQAWPVPREQLPTWIAERVKQHGLSISKEALLLLTELTEGNLLYTAQSIEKLALIYSKENHSLTSEEVKSLVEPQMNYHVFQLTEAFLQVDKNRALKICRSLRDNNTELPLILGAMLKELRILSQLKTLLQEKPFSTACQELGIWEKQRPWYQTSLNKRSLNFSKLFLELFEIERLLKTNSSTHFAWLHLEKFLLFS